MSVNSNEIEKICGVWHTLCREKCGKPHSGNFLQANLAQTTISASNHTISSVLPNPETGQFSQSSGDGQGNGAGYQADETSLGFSDDQSDMQFYRKAFYPVASSLRGIMETMLELTPIEMACQAVQGTGLWDKHLSAGERAAMCRALLSP